MWEIRAESASDEAAFERLVDAGFGPGRFAKTAYRLREGVAPETRLSFVAENPETHGLVGAVRFWPVIVGRSPALLLGPLAVDPNLRGRGIGIAQGYAGVGITTGVENYPMITESCFLYLIDQFAFHI